MKTYHHLCKSLRLKTTIVVWAFVLSLPTLLSAQISTGKVVLTGQVINRDEQAPRTLVVNLCDPVNETHRVSTTVDEQGAFRVEMDFSCEHQYSFIYGDQIYYGYAAPGDSVHLTVDVRKVATKAADALVYTGDNRDMGNMFIDIGKRVELMAYATRPAAKDAPFATFVQTFERAYARLCDSIRTLTDRHRLDGRMQRILEADALFCAACTHLEQLDGRGSEEILAFYSLPIFRKDRPEYLTNMMYENHISNYLEAFAGHDSLVRKYKEEGRPEEAERRIREFIRSHPKGMFRDLLWVRFYRHHARQAAPAADEFALPAFYAMLDRQRETKAARDTQAFSFDNPGNHILYLDGEGQSHGIEGGDFMAYLRRRYAGKVIYLDIWATWCGPCRAALRTNAPEVYRRYRDKDIVFVNLCLRSAHKAWLKAVSDDGIQQAENYYFDSDTSNLFMGQADLMGFPTYMLIGKDGRFITRQAPHLSCTEGLLPLLDRLLDEE